MNQTMKFLWKSRTAAALVVGLAALGCQDQINYLKARNELNRGVNAFSRSDYSFAIEHFEKAIELDPEFLEARQYLASSYMMQYVPGAESLENEAVAENALAGFLDVLDRSEDNEPALASIAILYFNMKRMEDARDWYAKLLEKFPENKDAYYTLGVIAWTETYQPRLMVRASLGMKPEDPGPIKDDDARHGLAELNLPVVEEGLKNLEKALEIDPEHDNSMAYINLLYRELADISETKEEYEKYTAMANEWSMKSLDTRKKKAEAATAETFQDES
jgi:tetratricopeptide (TPR) repeat protein